MAGSCRQCLLRELAGKEDVLAQVERARALMSGAERASDEEYDRRLAVCRACESLIDATCLKCGCYVELRALAAGARCPVKKWRVI